MDINIISLNGHFYGLPTSAVREVLDPVPITPLPFSPEYVDGLANIGGSVLVQTDLSVQLESAAAIPADKGQLIIISSGGELIALHVDQALLMVSVADDEINSVQVGEVHEELDFNLLTGVFQWQEASVLNLDVDQLGLTNIEQPTTQNGDSGLVATVESANDDSAQVETGASLESYLVVETCGENYALAMESVRFVEDLKAITTLPQAPPEVVGLTYSHEAPLLILGLGVLMGQRENAGGKLVIVEHQDFSCALRVDHLHGIHRLAFCDNHEVSARDDGELSGYLLGDGGDLIGVLNCDVLFAPQRIESLRRFLVDNHQRAAKKERIPTRTLLTFNVGHERCALPLTLVNRVVEYQEVELLPEGGGQHLHGAVQIHGDILPVIDLRIYMGIAQRNSSLTAYIVVGEEDNRWALVVDQVDRVVEIPETDFESTSSQEYEYLESIGRTKSGLLSVIRLESLTMATTETQTQLENSAECAG